MTQAPLSSPARVLVTGANGALGRAVVAAALASGAVVISVDLAFDGVAAERESRLAVDLTDATATTAALSPLADIDALYNVAGGFTMGEDAFDAGPHWDEMFRINVETLRNVLRAVVPGMRQRGSGRIVNVGALSAREGQAGMSAYCAAKGSVMRLTESLSRELRGSGINVNAVLPSILDTPRNRADMPDADFSRWVTPASLAGVMLFLGSAAARDIHGALLPVCGGS